MGTPAPTVEQVRRWILSLLPPGAENLYSLADGDGGIGDYFGAIAAATKAHGTDLVATLRQEIDPSTCDGKLPDWEAATGLSQSRVAQNGTTAERQAQLVSKLRESGASTLDNIRAAVQPFFQYVDPSLIEIIECDRAALTALHTYSWAAGAIPALGSYTDLVLVPDQANVSQGGAYVRVNISFPTIQDITIAIEGPSANPQTLAAGTLGTGAVVNQQYEFWVPAVADETVGGNWLLAVSNAAGNTGNVNVGGGDLTDIFVEGIGRIAFSDVQGLGSAQFEFAVAFDPSLSTTSTPDLMAARAAVQRIQPAHTIGYVVQYMGGGGICAIADDASAIVNGCVVC